MPALINHEIARAAKAWGEKLPDGVVSAIRENIVHAEEAKKGPYYTLLWLLGSYTPDQLNALPEPGVPEFEEVNGAAVKNNHGCSFKYMNDNNREVDGDYYNVAFDWTPPGIEIANLLDALANTKNNPSSPFFELKDGEIEAKQKNARNRRTTGRKSLRAAMAAYHTMNYCNQITGVKCVIRTVPRLDENKQAVKDANGQPVYDYDTSSPTPFLLMCIEEQGGVTINTKCKEYSCTGLAQLDPKKVIREGGGYSELIRTAAKGADDSEEEEADALVVTADNFTAVMAMIGNLIERKDTFPKVVKALTGKNADKAAIRTFGDAMVELIPLFKQVEPAYLQQLDERSKNIDTMVTRMTSVAAAPSIVPPAAAPAPAVANQ